MKYHTFDLIADEVVQINGGVTQAPDGSGCVGTSTGKNDTFGLSDNQLLDLVINGPELTLSTSDD